MIITEICLRRPIIVIALSSLLFICGLFALVHLPAGLYPKVDMSDVSITAHYPGASAELMDGRVTSEILSSISGVDGADYVTSTSSPGASEVDVHLNIGSNLQKVLEDIRERVDAISSFPINMDPPQVVRKAPDGPPDLAFSFTSKMMKPAQMSDYFNRVFKPRLESLNGVGRVEILGSQYAMWVQLDPDEMERYNVTAEDISQSLKTENIRLNAGALHHDQQRFQLVSDTGLSTVSDFNNLPITTKAGMSAVRLGDVAKIKLAKDQLRTKSVYDNKPAATIFIYWQLTSNPLSVAHAVNQTIASLATSFPYDLKAHSLIDTSQYIGGAIHEVFLTILLTCIAVTLAILLGSGTLRAVIIPVIAIPLSLISVCLLIYLLGFSINLLTLLAMVLATGLVVDDAIVVLDITLQRMQVGESPYQATLSGIKEVSGSLIIMTLTLAITYIPLIFVGGIVAKLFLEFAVTLAGSVIISGILALSLTPVMCSRMLSQDHQNNPMVIHAESFFSKMRKIYARLLIKILRYRKISLWVWFFSLIGVVTLFLKLPHELAPKEDQGYLMVISQGSSVMGSDYIDQQMPKLKNIYHSIPEIANFNYAVGVPEYNQLLSFVRLKERPEKNDLL